MGKRLEQALAEADDIERAEADADPNAPIPAHVKVSRPGRARSKVLQVRLNPDEFDALEEIAERRGLPVSTVAREQLLRLIAADEAAQPR
ncbi:ribbon-helix-helix domain-containing protein [Mycolicibacter virginiensis]|uniref:ribbon-helix-helix domain-containing protein n=1 Tax=Mycolicibacter virginiensis TaxID=1795032 RepID=UPI001F04AFBD|nr:ribbon-helix-helix domain-containing protein [Mycolicibacter virginiensis]ULP45937.1 ribbon-helix-helix domain-containing protein [Mycolicibacter virginiensis]